jgi:glycosyltransferase involved in cell wall biosynthesis
MSSLVSVIIPAYNAAPWLAEAVRSALAQTWPHCEIIIVNDGSTDATLAIAKTFSDVPGVTIVDQSNAGAASARNAGLRAARGEWLQFLDADDLLAPGKIAAQLALAATFPSNDFALCGRWSRFTDTPGGAAPPPQRLCADASPVDWIAEKLTHHAMMHPAAWLISRHLAERAGPWDASLSLDDDGEYFSRVVLVSSGVRYCADAVSFYRSALPRSLSKSRSARAWESALSSLEKTSTRLGDVESSPRTRSACATAFQRFIFEAYPAARDSRRRAAALVAAYGGSNLQPAGGARFQMLRRILGWKLARRMQKILPAHR